MTRLIPAIGLSLALLFGAAPVAATASSPEPRLTLIDPARGEAETALTLSDIVKLGTTVVKTTTPWHNGTQTFEGVPLGALVQGAGIKGKTLVVKALNNYVTEIPFADLEKFRVILAYKRNGEFMPVSDKGPFFIIYPFDANPELKSEVYYSRAAWQVKSITVE